MIKEDTIVVHNIKNPGYRQVHVDGAQGGLTPSGYINLSFYSQRGAIPKGTEFTINDEGKTLEPVRDIEGSKNGIVREFEVGIYMDIETCKNLKVFLDKKIEEFEQISEQRNG